MAWNVGGEVDIRQKTTKNRPEFLVRSGREGARQIGTAGGEEAIDRSLNEERCRSGGGRRLRG